MDLKDIGEHIINVLSIDRCNNLFDCIGAIPESLDLGKAAVPVVLTANGRDHLSSKSNASHGSENPRSSAHAKLRRILNVYQAVIASCVVAPYFLMLDPANSVFAPE